MVLGHISQDIALNENPMQTLPLKARVRQWWGISWLRRAMNSSHQNKV
jgi:hypothetical protein